ncbi:MAG: SOS response-associated peptidase [Bacteroidota bacterium]
MCGRYSIVIEEEKLRRQFGESLQLPSENGALPTNYNVAPTQNGLVLTDEQPERLSLFRWGLVPFWAKDLKIGSRMINARSEGIVDKPAFRQAIRKRRCLVIADSFYEWKRVGKDKQPYRILPIDGSLLIMAGIWEVWRGPNRDEEPTFTYSIITGPPNLEMQPLHNRMPILLQDEQSQSAWLGKETDLPLVQKLMQTPDDGLLKSYLVSKAVGNVRNNGAELHEEMNLD